jgi:short-subunit dehydrogenase
MIDMASSINYRNQCVNDELPTLVITGASSGIGLALAKKLATLTDRYRIVLSAREQSMPALKKTHSWSRHRSPHP